MLNKQKQLLEFIQLTKLHLLTNLSLDAPVFISPLSFPLLASTPPIQASKKLPPQTPIVEPINTPFNPPNATAPTPVEVKNKVHKEVVSPISTPPSTPPVMVETTTDPQPQTVVKPVTPIKAEFKLESIESPAPYSMDQGLKQFMESSFPHTKLIETIPLRKASKIEEPNPATSAIILHFYEEGDSLVLLQNITNAINTKLGPARLLNGLEIEKNRDWEQFLTSGKVQLIISNDHGLYLQTQLMNHYHQDEKKGTHSLYQIPLLLLSNLSLYQSRPDMKKMLWNAIQNQLVNRR